MESAESLLQKAQEIDSYVEKERLKNENELRETIQKKRCESEAYIHSISSKNGKQIFLLVKVRLKKKLEDYKVQEMKKEESWEEAIRFFQRGVEKNNVFLQFAFFFWSFHLDFCEKNTSGRAKNA